MKKFLLFILTFLIIYSFQYEQQNCFAQEIDGEVEELYAFHEIIYPIWHDAYPKKDYKALRSYLSEVNKLAGDLYSVELPGILRDKQNKWEEGIADFKRAVAEYNKSARGSNDEALLKAAANLHSKYETMVRIIRPVLKEVDEFHKVLYVVYHKYLPGENYEAIKSVSKELVSKAEAITNAKLPKRLEDKAHEFEIEASNLLKSSRELEKICKEDSNQNINTAVNKLHLKYQELGKIFD